jgi:[FeFe] hydrogenase H-cluster maturation GTPase HydF
MQMNETPLADRIHIAFLGRRNAGKSSLVNAVTGQNLSIVSDVRGTTTDPVYKAMELLPLGPVVIIDTPGFDDEGELGEMRVNKVKQVLNKTDAAVLVIDREFPSGKMPCAEEELISTFRKKNIPYITVINKCDTENQESQNTVTKVSGNKEFIHDALPVSAKTGFNINLLKEKIAALVPEGESKQRLVSDLIKPDDFTVLVIPIDKAAPKGRLILPQQQVIRDILEAGGCVIAVRERELSNALANLGKKPALVITDSQVFAEVSAVVPQEIPLTSFSILFARYKGFLKAAVNGIAVLDNIQDRDKILICEGCTHHRQCDDIGTVKIPLMIKKYVNKEPEFCFCSGGDFPNDLSAYKLIIHCGSCMLNEREMQFRRNHAEEQNIPFTNYGIAIAHIQGILKRSVRIFNFSEEDAADAEEQGNK